MPSVFVLYCFSLLVLFIILLFFNLTLLYSLFTVFLWPLPSSSFSFLYFILISISQLFFPSFSVFLSLYFTSPPVPPTPSPLPIPLIFSLLDFYYLQFLMLFSAYFAFCERNKIRLMQSPSCRCVCVFKTVCLRIPQTNSECLNQCS